MSSDKDSNSEIKNKLLDGRVDVIVQDRPGNLI